MGSGGAWRVVRAQCSLAPREGKRAHAGMIHEEGSKGHHGASGSYSSEDPREHSCVAATLVVTVGTQSVSMYNPGCQSMGQEPLAATCPVAGEVWA